MKKEIKLKDKMSDESRIVVVKQQLQQKVSKKYISQHFVILASNCRNLL